MWIANGEKTGYEELKWNLLGHSWLDIYNIKHFFPEDPVRGLCL